MALTGLQRRIMACLAANRSESSYVAGGVALNKDWPRRSDDIDIFHDTDEEIGAAADRDIQFLRAAGFDTHVEVDVYGIVEARVADRGEETLVQWMSESRRRFLPLIRDGEWGARLAPADLAVNKVLAAGTRRKARDVVDLVSIGTRLCPLGPLVMAAAGKPPHFSPQRMIDEIRRNALSIWNEDYLAVKGMPDGWSPPFIRDSVTTLLDSAEAYILSAPAEIVGRLALGRDGCPVEVYSVGEAFQLRAPSEEPEVVPQFADVPLHRILGTERDLSNS